MTTSLSLSELTRAVARMTEAEAEAASELNWQQQMQAVRQEQRQHSRQARMASLYKTELCRSFEETGACPYATKCQFAHSLLELRNVPRHPRYKTEICRTFWEQGWCPYGKRCCFIHNEQQLHNDSSSSSLSPAFIHGLGALDVARYSHSPADNMSIAHPRHLAAHSSHMAHGANMMEYTSNPAVQTLFDRFNVSNDSDSTLTMSSHSTASSQASANALNNHLYQSAAFDWLYRESGAYNQNLPSSAPSRGVKTKSKKSRTKNKNAETDQQAMTDAHINMTRSYRNHIKENRPNLNGNREMTKTGYSAPVRVYADYPLNSRQSAQQATNAPRAVERPLSPWRLTTPYNPILFSSAATFHAPTPHDRHHSVNSNLSISNSPLQIQLEALDLTSRMQSLSVNSASPGPTSSASLVDGTIATSTISQKSASYPSPPTVTLQRQRPRLSPIQVPRNSSPAVDSIASPASPSSSHQHPQHHLFPQHQTPKTPAPSPLRSPSTSLFLRDLTSSALSGSHSAHPNNYSRTSIPVPISISAPVSATGSPRLDPFISLTENPWMDSRVSSSSIPSPLHWTLAVDVPAR